MADYLDLPITYANIDGITNPDELPDQFDVCLKAKAFKVPNTDKGLCAHYLKTKPFLDFLSRQFPNQDVVIYYGFDASETNRKVRRQGIMGLLGYDTDYPLADWQERTIYSTREVGITPPLTYGARKHGNCDGCLKGGIQSWYVTYCTRADVYDKADNTETILGYAILKRSVNGKSIPFYLKEAREIFARMKCAGVPASEHYDPANFKRQLKRYGIEELVLFKPCECVM